MSIWSQIGNERIMEVPPDGATRIDIYAAFSFSGDPVPEGVPIKFLIGIGKLPKAAEGEVLDLTEQDVVSCITPVKGLELESSLALVEDQTVVDSSGVLSVMAVAKATVKPISDILQDKFTVVAYSTYDKLGSVARMSAQEISITVTRFGGTYLATLQAYDPGLDAWEEKATPPTGRTGVFCGAISGKVYACGGFNTGFPIATEKYDPISNSWAAKAPMPRPRGFGCSVVYNSKLYVFGGFNLSSGNRALDMVDVYDPAANTWTQLASMPAPVTFGTAQVVGTNAYVLYGASKMTKRPGVEEDYIGQFNFAVFKYDILFDTWTTVDVVVAGAVSIALTAGSSAGDLYLSIPASALLPPYGVVTLDRGGLAQETVPYLKFDAINGRVQLASALQNAHALGATVNLASLPDTRIAPVSYLSGTNLRVLNGKSFLGYTSDAISLIRGSEVEFDTATGIFSQVSLPPPGNLLPRYRAGATTLAGTTYIVGGSAAKSTWLNDTQSLTGTTFAALEEMKYEGHSFGVAEAGGLVYAVGGSGSGHAPGWLRINTTATPSQIRADGKETASIEVEAVDASGDPPPDGTKLSVRGLIYVQLTAAEKEQIQKQKDAAAAAGQAQTTAIENNVVPQKVSILPVLFSGQEMTMVGGIAATLVLARSEDFVNEVENLLNKVKANEAVATQDQLKDKFGGDFRYKTMTVGEKRQLYSVAIEVSVLDPFFFGQTDTDATIAGAQSADIGDQSGFSFDSPSAQQGLSASVGYYSDIASIPDVSVVDEEVSAADALSLLDRTREDIPFGASPHYDALVTGARARNIAPPAPPLTASGNIMVSVSDNDESNSSYSPEDVVSEANAVAGRFMFPVFVTTFIVTDPVSLSARRSRTDVAALEMISSETGGNSFSVVDPTFVSFVIDRINSSAPASIGSGTILSTHQFDGTLSAVRYNMGNLSPTGNLAEMRVWYSLDGYNFTDIGVVVPPNQLFVLSSPVATKVVRYEVRLQSSSFDSPILTEVDLRYVQPNIQYVFTYPISVAGQVSELTGAANHHLPAGGSSEIGFVHGESLDFERDYYSSAQPDAKERGVIVAVNRSFDTFIGDKSTADILHTDDFIVYRSKSGPWPQDAIAIVSVNDQESNPSSFIARAEEGLIAFRDKLSATDVVTLEVQMPPSFRVGVKVANPALQEGKLDSFAYMFGSTEDESGNQFNRPPRAVNLFISPIPAMPGGPMEANYTFVDPDGNAEDKDKTRITWYRNGAPVPELANKRKISNSDLLARRVDQSQEGMIWKDQQWFFTVRPSDGRSYGPLATSHTVVIANIPPEASDVVLRSSNKDDPNNFTTSDTISVDFKFTDEDDDKQSGVIYSWFANGILVKTGEASTLEPADIYNDKKVLAPGVSIRTEVTPSDGTDFGTAVSSDTISVKGTPPTVKDVIVKPIAPSPISNLKISYVFSSVDGTPDQSLIGWFRNGQRVSELDNATNVQFVLLAPGQSWYAVVTPYDGNVEGTPVKSNVVTVQF